MSVISNLFISPVFIAAALCCVLPGCAVVSVADAVVSTGASAVSTAASVTGSVVKGTVSAVTP